MVVASSLPDISSSTVSSTHLRLVSSDDATKQRRRRRRVGNHHVVMFGKCGGGNISAPRRIPQLAGKIVKTMCAGDGFTVVSTEGGRTYRWGHNLAGSTSSPVLVDSLNGLDVVSISCSRRNVVAITKDGKAFTWGKYDEKITKKCGS